ncbi:MAG: hypothetical protein ACYC7A_19395 [Thermoanaerobaculia bacterium]
MNSQALISADREQPETEAREHDAGRDGFQNALRGSLLRHRERVEIAHPAGRLQEIDELPRRPELRHDPLLRTVERIEAARLRLRAQPDEPADENQRRQNSDDRDEKHSTFHEVLRSISNSQRSGTPSG